MELVLCIYSSNTDIPPEIYWQRQQSWSGGTKDVSQPQGQMGETWESWEGTWSLDTHVGSGRMVQAIPYWLIYRVIRGSISHLESNGASRQLWLGIHSSETIRNGCFQEHYLHLSPEMKWGALWPQISVLCNADTHCVHTTLLHTQPQLRFVSNVPTGFYPGSKCGPIILESQDFFISN